MNNDSLEAVLVFPPCSTAQLSKTGIPENTYLAFPSAELQDASRKRNTQLSAITTLVSNSEYARAASALPSIKDVSSVDLQELLMLREALANAYKKSDDQQQEIWDSTHLIGITNACCILLDQPLTYVLPAPPETICAAFSSTACLMYLCLKHAKQAKNLDTIRRYLSTISTVPPLYTITVPPPTISMQYASEAQQTSHIEPALESLTKKTYDGCRNRSSHKK